MQVTKELLQNDVDNLEKQLKQFEAQAATTAGALAAIRGVLEYMNKAEPEVAPVEVVPVPPPLPVEAEVVQDNG